jgi:ribosomal protein S18 acetylase RimI-like enzyme
LLDKQIFARSERGLSVTAMKAPEADAVADLFQTILFALPYYNEKARSGELAKYSSSMLIGLIKTDPQAVLVAHSGHDPVGFCFSEIDDGLIWLAWLGVHPSYRRRGIGRELVQQLESRARFAPAHKIWCDCRTNNDSSIASLTANGFQTIGTVQRHWHGQDYILWEKYVS